jgi:tetratricopeptide (TPR) repeat protein
MAELRLRFDRDADGSRTVQAHYVDPDGNLDTAEPRPFAFALAEAEYRDLRWYLEDYLDLPDGGSQVRARRIEQWLDGLGRRLFAAVFDHADHRELYDRLKRAKAANGAATPTLTLGTSDSEILRLPWELMADRKAALVQQGIALRRQLESLKEVASFRADTPLRVLVVVSRPDDAGFIDPRHSARSLLDALEPLGGDVAVEFCQPPTLAELERRLADAKDRRAPYHIVHFDGHGDYDERLGLGVLAFESADQEDLKVKTDAVPAERLGNLLASHSIPLVVLEACRTSSVGAVAFRSVAPRLIEAGVGSVIAMSYAVHVEAAKILVERFYEKLVRGKTVGDALGQARAALLAQAERWVEPGPSGRKIPLVDWFLPQLYQAGKDLSLVAERDPDTPAPAPRLRKALPHGKEPGAFPAPPRYEFQGRARELGRLTRAFQHERAVLLYAMGGMGKTALSREAAHWLTRTGMFPDGACFVSFEQPTTAEDVARLLGTYLEGEAFEQKPPDEQLKAARHLFATQRVLMVWDNFESVLPSFAAEGDGAGYHSDERDHLVALYRDWTDEPGKGRLLVTCRPEDTPLVTAQHMELFGLSRPDSLTLLARVLRKHSVSLDDPRFAHEEARDDLNNLLATLGDHPLSIELVAPHLRSRTPKQIIEEFEHLLGSFKGEAEVERNRSLLASLRFSTDHLSEEARAALRWLGLFQGGVFEQLLLDISQLAPEAWARSRAELEATALVKVEDEIQVVRRPYLRFHPTLAAAAATLGRIEQKAEAAPPAPLRDQAEVRVRFVAVYDALDNALTRALSGNQGRGAMEVLRLEERNFRQAVCWAVEAGEFDLAAPMGQTFRQYLERSHRMRERDRWAEWLAEQGEAGPFSEAVAVAQRNAAWALFTQGQGDQALALLARLKEQLESTSLFDPAFQLANVNATLGRILYSSGQAARAIPILEQTCAAWKRLGERAAAGGRIPETAQGNLGASLGDLANALQFSGRLPEALEAAEAALAIATALKHDRQIAAGLGRCAQILMGQGKYDAADAKYVEAIATAERCGDKELEAKFLQHRGTLAQRRGQHGTANKLYRHALNLFQQAHDDDGVLLTYNQLGVVEALEGRHAEARAWFERARELAQQRGSLRDVAGAHLNIGITHQEEAEQARAAGDDARARSLLDRAKEEVAAGLKIFEELNDEPHLAASLGQLAGLHLLTGDLDQAEVLAHRSREIHERLGLKEVRIDYNTLAEIAKARGNREEAAEWAAKRDAEAAAQRERAGSPGIPEEFLMALAHLGQACLIAAANQCAVEPAARDVLDQLSSGPPPFPALGTFLAAVAARSVPPVPPALPPALADLCTKIRGVAQEIASGAANA